MPQQELLLKQGGEEERVVGYNTDHLHQELTAAMVNAAHEINKKYRGRRRGSFRKIFSSKGDEILIEEDVITAVDQVSQIISNKRGGGRFGGTILTHCHWSQREITPQVDEL